VPVRAPRRTVWSRPTGTFGPPTDQGESRRAAGGHRCRDERAPIRRGTGGPGAFHVFSPPARPQQVGPATRAAPERPSSQAYAAVPTRTDCGPTSRWPTRSGAEA